MLPRIERINFAEIAGRWLETPGHVRSLRTRIVGMIEGAVDGLSDGRIREFSDREVIPRLREVALAPKLSDLLLGLARDGQHEDLLDEVLQGAASVAAANRDAIYDVVRAQMPSLIAVFAADLVTDAVMGKIDTTIQAMLSDRENPLRVRIHERVQEFLERLDHDPAMQAKVDALRDRVLENPALRDFAVERWGDFKGFLVRDLHDEDSAIFGFLEARGVEFGRSMLEDEAFQHAVNEKVAAAAAWAIQEHGQRIPDLIRDTIERWPAEAGLGPHRGGRRQRPPVDPHQRHPRGRPRRRPPLPAHHLARLHGVRASLRLTLYADIVPGESLEVSVLGPEFCLQGPRRRQDQAVRHGEAMRETQLGGP